MMSCFRTSPHLPARTWQDGTLEFCGEAYNYQTLVFDISWHITVPDTFGAWCLESKGNLWIAIPLCHISYQFISSYLWMNLNIGHLLRHRHQWHSGEGMDTSHCCVSFLVPAKQGLCRMKIPRILFCFAHRKAGWLTNHPPNQHPFSDFGKMSVLGIVAHCCLVKNFEATSQIGVCTEFYFAGILCDRRHTVIAFVVSISTAVFMSRYCATATRCWSSEALSPWS